MVFLSSLQLSKIDARIMRVIAGMHQLEVKLDPSSVYGLSVNLSTFVEVLYVSCYMIFLPSLSIYNTFHIFFLIIYKFVFSRDVIFC